MSAAENGIMRASWPVAGIYWRNIMTVSLTRTRWDGRVGRMRGTKSLYRFLVTRMRWDGRVVRMRWLKILYRFLVDKCDGKRLFGSSKMGWQGTYESGLI